MLLTGSIKSIEKIISARKKEGKSIGFVPTMGALHEGHISLIKRSVSKCDYTVASIFVNPIQFGPKEDFSKYPRTLGSDRKMLEQAGCDLVFVPSADVMYSDRLTTVHVEGITDILCGKTRKGHFDGVTTVVSKLFNIVNPDYAFFGMKDYQQLAVIRKMTEDLNFPIRIEGCPIVREKDGLAMSSRNRYLSEEDRSNAPRIYAVLKEASCMLKKGNRIQTVRNEGIRKLNSVKHMKTEYFEILTNDLMKPEGTEKKLHLFTAVRLGKTRLIDNLEVRIR